MRWSIIFLLVLSNSAQAIGSGEVLAYPPIVVLSERWLHNHAVPVYQVTLRHAGEHAELQAAEAALSSVRPEFRQFSTAMINSIDNYVIDRQQQGSVTIIYIRRSIVADWLITS